MYAYKTVFSIARTTPQSSPYMFLHWNQRNAIGIRTTDPEVRGKATYLLPHSISCVHRPRLVYMYLHVRVDVWEKMTKIRNPHPPPGDDASTAEAAPGRVGRDVQCEACRASSTPNGGPHLDLIRGRSRVKTWSKSDFSIAETTWPTYLRRIHLFIFAFFSTLQNIYVSLCGKFC